jgi:polar amino acid transport system ATP-binding protein
MAFCAKINELSGDLGTTERSCSPPSAAPVSTTAAQPISGRGTT